MTRLIKLLFGSLIAKVYISIIKPSIDTYITKSQLQNAKIGVNTKLYRRGVVYFSEGLCIGDNCAIGENYFFHAKGGITIGDSTILSRNVTIYSANHNYNSNIAIPYDNTYVKKEVVIGSGVWIGMGVYILPGVTIGDGAILGMGSIITKDVGDGEIVVSSQQRTLKERNMIKFEELKGSGKFYNEIFR